MLILSAIRPILNITLSSTVLRAEVAQPLLPPDISSSMEEKQQIKICDPSTAKGSSECSRNTEQEMKSRGRSKPREGLNVTLGRNQGDTLVRTRHGVEGEPGSRPGKNQSGPGAGQ